MNNSIKVKPQPYVKKTYMMGETLAPYLFIAPFIFSFLLFFLVPSVYSFILSFFNYRGYGNAYFVGFSNYISLLTYKTFWISVWNTLFYLIVSSVPVMVIAFFVAVLISSMGKHWQRIYKPMIFLPQIMAIVSASLVWKVILSTRSGVINHLLGTQIPFIDDPALMKWSVVLLLIWKSIGWFFVVFLTGLTTVSDDVKEAAVIDGASAVQSLFYITVPIMKPIFLFAFIMETIQTLKIYTQPNLLISGWLNAPPEAMPIVSVLVNNVKTGYFGMASAVGWLLFIMILGASMLQYILLNERREGR